MALGGRRSRESPWSFPRQTNRQTDKQKNMSTQRFELSTLLFLAQCSYRLNYRAVLIWLLLSDYYYQIDKTFWPHRGSNSRLSRFWLNALTDWAIGPYSSDYFYRITIMKLLLSWIWLKSWSNQGLRITVIRIQQDILDRNPVVDIRYLLFWEILLTNKQTNKQTDKQKNMSTQRFELSTLLFLAQCSYRLNYRAVLIWLLLSDYYYQIDKTFWPHRGSNSRLSRFWLNALTDWAIGPYSSDYFYRITIMRLLLSWIWMKSWSKKPTSSSWETVIRISDPYFNPDHPQLWTQSSYDHHIPTHQISWKSGQ